MVVGLYDCVSALLKYRSYPKFLRATALCEFDELNESTFARRSEEQEVAKKKGRRLRPARRGNSLRQLGSPGMLQRRERPSNFRVSPLQC